MLLLLLEEHDGESDAGDGDESEGDPIERTVGPRFDADHVVAVTGGTIRLFKAKGAKPAYFRAVCDCGHRRCDLTRTTVGTKKPKAGSVAAAQGRPLGLLAAWLREGRGVCVHDKGSHKRASCSRAKRVAARRELKAMPDVTPLFEAERKKRPGEDSEPEEEAGQKNAVGT